MPNDLAGSPVPDLLLEQYRLNELHPDDANRVGDALASDPSVAERLRAIELSDAEIERTYPPERIAQRLRDRLDPAKGLVASAFRRKARWVLPLVLTAAAATFAFSVPGILPSTRPDGDAGGDRLKGSRPSLVVYRKTARGGETLADGAVARPGDVVRLAYSPADRAYGLIVSVDPRGTVTQHLPETGDRAVKLARDRMNLLATAYELDDVPGWERFYFVTSDTAFDVAPIVNLVRRAATAPPGRATELPLSRSFE